MGYIKLDNVLNNINNIVDKPNMPDIKKIYEMIIKVSLDIKTLIIALQKLEIGNGILEVIQDVPFQNLQFDRDSNLSVRVLSNVKIALVEEITAKNKLIEKFIRTLNQQLYETKGKINEINKLES